MKRAPKTLLILVALLCCAGLLKATLPQTSIGRWTSTVGFSEGRSNASAVMLSDGRILITGGNGASGPLQSGEFFGTDGTVSSAAAMNVPRSGHFAVILGDGRVLVGGGLSGGGTTNSAEIYDPSADSWTKTSAMAEARANATAALLQDGHVLIAGGDNSGNASNTIEIFDPSNDSFTFAGTLSAARTKHAMATLQDGRVLIVGGTDGTNPLASSDIFDPSSGNVSAGPSLATARYAHSATTLLNGRVAIIGGTGSDGNGGTTDLASIEVFDPALGAFKTVSVSLATARQGHQAFLLPNNNSVLIVGGTSGGQVVAASELFTPQVSPADGSWSYAVNPTGSNVTPRSAATGSAMQQDGLLLAAGGTDASGNPLASAELYAFPVVKTNQADYPPGTPVNITGSGFQPGENVNITLVESPLIDTHGPYSVTADPNGNISDSSFTTDLHDVNVRFWLSATGSQSGLVAQNTFTDAPGDTPANSVSCTSASVTAGTPVTCTATSVNTGGTNSAPQGTMTFSYNGAAGTFTFSPITCNLAQVGTTSVSNCTTTFTPDDVMSVNGKVQANFNSNDTNKWKNGNPGTFSITVTAGTFAKLQLLVPGETAAPGTATGFIGTPNAQTAGTAFNITVNAVDANWNAVSSTNTVQITSTDSSATLPANAALVAGTKSFSMTLKTTPSQTITASDVIDGTKAPSTSPAIPVTAASANKLVFAQQPTDANVGTTITPAITVKVEDLFNNVVTTSSASVTLSITTGTGTAGAVLACTTGLSHNASSGIATFPDCNINNAGTNYQLHAVASGLTAVDSSQFNIISPISKLGFITGPFTGAINQCLGPISVQTQNTGGTGTNPSAPVQADLSIASGGTGAFFSDAACGSAITNVSILTTANSASFFFKGASTGSPTAIQAADHAGVLTSATQGETINARSTTTVVSFATNPVTYGGSTNTTVTVTDTDANGTKSFPTGAVTVASDSGDTIAAPCTLASTATAGVSTCMVAVTPTHASIHTISASYPGDTAHSSSSDAGESLTVSPKALTVTGTTVADHLYDGLTNATLNLGSASLVGVVSGDTVSVSSSGYTANFATKNVGNGIAVTVTGLTLSGGSAGNYTLTQPTGLTGNITPKTLTVTGITVADHVYDGTTTASLIFTGATLQGVVSPDVVTANMSGYSATFASSKAASGISVTVSGLTLGGAQGGNYTLKQPSGLTGNITPATLTLSIIGATGIYNAMPLPAMCKVASGLIGSDTVTLNVSYVAGVTPVVIPINAGSYTAACISSGNSNYNAAMAQAAVTISPATLTVTADNQSMTFGGTAPAFTAQISGFQGSDDKSLVSGLTFTAQDSSNNPVTDFTILKAGNYPIVPSGASATNYTFTYVNGTLTVNKATLAAEITVTPVDPATVAYGQPVSATVNLKSYSIGGVPVLRPHEDSQDSTKILPESLTVYLVPNGGGPAQAVKFATATAVPTYDNTTNTSGTNKTGWTATISGKAPTPGNYFAFVYGDDPGDNSLTNLNLADASYFFPDTDDISYPTLKSGQIDVVQASVIGSFTVSDKVYDTTTTASITSRSLSGVINGDEVSLTDGTATFSDKSVGNGKTVTGTGFTLGGANASNYKLDSTTLTTTASITPATVTGGFTANSKTYDAKTTATIASRSLTGVLSGDSVALYGGTATFSDKNVAAGKTVTGTGFTLNGTDAGNYQLASTTLTTTADITALHVVGSFTTSNKIYDGTTVASVLTRTVAPIVGDNLYLSGGTAAFSDKNVGTAKTVTLAGAALTGTDASNYYLDSVATTTADITALHITGKFTTQNKQYDGNASATVLSESPVGAISGDVVSLTGGTASFSDKNVATGKTVTLTGAVLSGADAGNYILDSVATTTADITARPLKVNATGVDKVYDGNTTATVTLSDNRISGDVFTDSYSSATFVDKNVGNGKTVSVSGISISGTDAGNYVLSNSTASTTANITARDLTVTAQGINKQYDGNATAAVTLSDDKVSGDSLTDNYTSATFADKNAANGRAVSVSGISVSGADVANYHLLNTTASTTADITKRILTISATGVNKVYDGTTTATVSLSDDRISGDVFTDSYTNATFADKNVGTIKAVSVSGISIAGVDAGNYTFNTTASTTADITARKITVTAATDSKTYDGGGSSTGTPTITYGSVAAGDTPNFTQVFDSRNAGTRVLTPSGSVTDGNSSNNYAVTFKTADGTISPLSISVTAVSDTKVYDGNVNSTGIPTIGPALISPDIATFTQTFDSKNAGARTLTPSGSVNDGNGGQNYAPTFHGVAGSITQRPLTVTTDAKMKVYGDVDPPLTYGITNGSLVAGDVFSGALRRVAGENVGSYAIQVGTLTLGGNYMLTYIGANLSITPAPLTITPDGNKTKTLGAVFTAFTGAVSGLKFGDAVAVTYASLGAPAAAGVGSYNISVGSYNFTTGSAANYTITQNTAVGGLKVVYASVGVCAGDVGHTIRQPINADGTSVFKQKSTVPAKFAVCDVNGVSIGTAGVVTSFRMTGMGSGTVVDTVDETVVSTTPDTSFRWDPTGLQWIFNMDTKSLTANMTYQYTIGLNDGSSIVFVFGLK